MHAHSIVVLMPLVWKPSWCLSANQSKGGPAVGTASLFARSVAAVCLYRQDMVLGRFDVSDGCGGGCRAGEIVKSLDVIYHMFVLACFVEIVVHGGCMWFLSPVA